MNIILAFTQFLMISAILIQEVKWKSPGMFLWATLFLMFGLMHFYDVIMGVDIYEESIMINASFFVISFCFFYEITRLAFRKISCTRTKQTFLQIAGSNMAGGENTFVLVLLLIIASIMISLNLIIKSGGILNTSWGKAREIAGEGSYLSGNQIWTIIYNSMGGILCCSLLTKSKIKIIISFICLFFVELVTRNRVLILPLLISIMAYYIFKIKRIKLSTIIFAIVGAAVVIYIIYAIRAFRWLGDLNTVLETFSFKALNEQIKIFLVTSDGELGLRKWMYYYMEHENQFANFGQGHTYLRMLFVYIPTRLSFGLKPPDFAISMGVASGLTEGGSMHPTLFGDCYANLGYFGIILGVLWALLIHFNDKVIDRLKNPQMKVLAFVLLSTSYVIIGRGAVYNGFFNIAWGIPLLIVLSKLKLQIPYVRLMRRTYMHYGKEQI